MSPKNLVLLSMVATAFISGSVGQHFYPGEEFPPSALCEMLLLSLLTFVWYRLDTNQLGYRRTPWLNVGVIGISIVALPYYFFRARGVKNGFIYLSFFILAIITYGFALEAGRYAAYYALQS